MNFFKDFSLSSFTAGFVAVLVGFTSSVAIVFQAAQALHATPEMIARREAALENVRKLNPYRDITDPVAWQREIREDRPLPGRDYLAFPAPSPPSLRSNGLSSTSLL